MHISGRGGLEFLFFFSLLGYIGGLLQENLARIREFIMLG